MVMFRVRVCLRGLFNVFTQYVVRIETLIRGFFPERILPEGIMSKGDYVQMGFCPGFHDIDKVSDMTKWRLFEHTHLEVRISQKV